jgi:vitamin B12 transporter
MIANFSKFLHRNSCSTSRKRPRRRKNFSPAALTLAVLSSGLPAVADETDQGQETVVVTATRIPTPELQVANSMTVITAADIEAKRELALPNLLTEVPGLNVVQEGGPGGQTSIFMRGTNSNHVKVLIDGIDVSDPSSPTDEFDFGQLLTADIQQIEILRGPQSGLYGSDAIGGVINVITKSGEGPAQLTAGLEGGSFDTFNQTGSVRGQTDGFHYSAVIEHYDSGATPVTPLDLLAPGEKRIDDSYDNVTASTKLGYDVTDSFDIGLVGRYTNSHLEFTGDNFVTGYPDASQSESQTIQYYARATAHLVSWNGFFEQTLGFGYSSINSTDQSPDTAAGFFSGDRTKLDWQGNLRFSDAEILVLGAEHERDEIRLPVSAATSINSGYAELQSNPATNFFDSVSLRYDGNEQFGGKLTYRIAPAYIVEATGTKLKASLGTGFKAPTLSEMFENFPSFGFFGNPNLKPESSIGYDAGFEQPFFDDTVTLGAIYFRNDIKNLIDTNASFTSYVNVGKAETDGVESFVAYQPMESLSLRADFTYTEANDEILQQELLRRPKYKATLEAKWRPTEALLVDADVLFVSSWIDINREGTIPRLKADGYTTADIAVSYDLTDELTAYGRIANLFDEHYENPIGFLHPGRGFFAGIKARI